MSILTLARDREVGGVNMSASDPLATFTPEEGIELGEMFGALREDRVFVTKDTGRGFGLQLRQAARFGSGAIRPVGTVLGYITLAAGVSMRQLAASFAAVGAAPMKAGRDFNLS